jgi:hypothetical protein
VIKGTIREWYKDSGKTVLPPDLTALALQAGIDPAEIIPSCSTTPTRGKCKKWQPPLCSGRSGQRKSLGVLSGVWPNLEEEAGLRSGKKRVKSRIEQFGGKVTSAISGLTDALIIGVKLGDKKLTQLHKKEVKVIDINTLNHLITPLTKCRQSTFLVRGHWSRWRTTQCSANLRHTCPWSRL